MTVTESELKLAIIERYKMIESLCFWEERLTTNHLQQFFNIGRIQASRDINSYKKLHPENITYDVHNKGYRPGESFTQYFSDGSFNEFISFNVKRYYSITEPLCSKYLEIIKLPTLELGTSIYKQLLDAARNERRIEVSYNAHDEQIICPHALIVNGDQIFMRAFSEQSMRFDTFELNQLKLIHEDEGEAYYNNKQDTDWHQMIEVSYQANSELSDEHQTTVNEMFNANGYNCSISIRAALLPIYVNFLPVKLSKNVKQQLNQELPACYAQISNSLNDEDDSLLALTNLKVLA
jgi:predicted DNA-binding transcriptional regulator YafY